MTWPDDDQIAAAIAELEGEHATHLGPDERAHRRNDLRHAARMLVQCRAGDCVEAGYKGSGCLGQRAHLHRERDELVIRYGDCARRAQKRYADRAAAIMASSRMPLVLQEKRLDDFKVTPANLEAVQKVRAAVLDRSKGLVLAGPSGVGKTHLAASLVNARLARNDAALFLTVPGLLEDLRKSKGRDDDLIRVLVGTPLLVLDDFGAERPTDFALEQLYLVIDGRMTHGRQTVVTTNYASPELLEAHLQETPNGHVANMAAVRIVQRLAQTSAWVMVGQDGSLFQ